MAYKIEQIEGIGEIICPETRKYRGISTSEQFALTACALEVGPREGQRANRHQRKTDTEWTHHADLFHEGRGRAVCRTPQAAGVVDTVREFRHRVAANPFIHGLSRVNGQKHLCGRVPSGPNLRA